VTARAHIYVHMGYGARLLELMLRACMGNLVRGRGFVCIGFPRFCFSWTKEKVVKGGGLGAFWQGVLWDVL
jgi:hypothetical protein